MVAKKKAKKAKKSTTTKKKEPAKKKAKGTIWRIEYSCDGGCTPDPEELHVNKGDTVVMMAVGTHVYITFRRSPFQKKSFSIAQDDSEFAEVTKDSGRFPYLLECGSCEAAVRLPPRIIID